MDLATGVDGRSVLVRSMVAYLDKLWMAPCEL